MQTVEPEVNLIICWKNFGVQRLPGAIAMNFFPAIRPSVKCLKKNREVFFPTDFLVKSFEKLIWQGLKINSHPEFSIYISGNFKRLVYLAQTESQALQTQAQEIAQRLGLNYLYRFTGYGALPPLFQI
ncbi:MAG: hypothetical protein Ct9H300mP28_35300 [Pseudomonadota bacterium]|nr:MAG: hypothetical protein Ct9H300mP28_35300 [Pseudomonadota bacterium]